MSFRRARSVLNAELAAIRRRDPDVDAGDITVFTLPLVLRAAGLAAIGVVPLLVVRNGAVENSQLVPIIGSTALVIICAAVVAWLMAIVISGLIVMILYRTRPAGSSQLVARILTDSFMRIEDSTRRSRWWRSWRDWCPLRSGYRPGRVTSCPTQCSTTC
jgi:hypothetical protein